MTTTAKYPSAALTDFGADLPGFPEATLSGAHNNSVTTITLTATVPTAWPTVGWVTIDSEIIAYGGKSGATLTSCTRGAQASYGGSLAASHSDQAKVGYYLTPQVVNQIIAEVLAIEGLTPSPTRYFGVLSTVAVPATQNFVGGTGAVTVQADGVQLDTGANANSFVRNITPLDSGQGVSVAPFGKVKFFRAMVRPLNNIAATVVYFHGIADRATAAATVFATDKHIGFKYDPATSGNWFGTVSNGAAASTLDTGVAVALNNDALLSFQYDGTTATFWVNGVNKGTIATANCPTGAVANQGLYLTNYIDNKAIANQRLVLAHSAEAIVSAV